MPALLILLSLVPAFFGTARLTELAGHAELTDDTARFLAHPVPVVLHILSVIPYSVLGALQFVPALRRHHHVWHRACGRVLAVLGIVAASSGLWMTLSYPWPAGDGVVLYWERLAFGSAMLVSILLGVNAIRRRHFAVHGAWMMRAYAIGLGAGTQVLTHLLWFLLVGNPEESARAFLMGIAWLLNLAVAEHRVRMNALRRPNVTNSGLA